MKLKAKHFAYDGQEKFNINKVSTKIDDFYADKETYDALMAEQQSRLDELQSMMYAHNRYGLLVILQAMDAAGKDGTIKAVFSGVNPIGLKIHSFKRPSEQELSHDYLWRHLAHLPERGHIAVFNRSYYEEVLVVKVHPEIVTNVQRLPTELTQDLDKLWEGRYEDMVNFERLLHRNGTRVVKIFLNVSKKEQAERLVERIEDPTKNWKFEEQDVKERGFWDDYQQAYEQAINATATRHAPWYVVPADDKKNMRLMVSQIVIEALEDLSMDYPEVSPERQANLQQLIKTIQQA